MGVAITTPTALWERIATIGILTCSFHPPMPVLIRTTIINALKHRPLPVSALGQTRVVLGTRITWVHIAGFADQRSKVIAKEVLLVIPQAINISDLTIYLFISQ